MSHITVRNVRHCDPKSQENLCVVSCLKPTKGASLQGHFGENGSFGLEMPHFEPETPLRCRMLKLQTPWLLVSLPLLKG